MKAKAVNMLDALRDRAEAQLTKAVEILLANGKSHPFTYSDHAGHHEDQVVNGYKIYKFGEDPYDITEIHLLYWSSREDGWRSVHSCTDIYDLAHDADLLLERAKEIAKEK